MYRRGEWVRQTLSASALIPSGLLPTPTPTAADICRGLVIALIPVAPASDVSFGHTDKSRPEELGALRGEACLTVCSWPEGSQTSVSSCSSAKAESLGRQAVQNACKKMRLDDLSFFFFLA